MEESDGWKRLLTVWKEGWINLFFKTRTNSISTGIVLLSVNIAIAQKLTHAVNRKSEFTGSFLSYSWLSILMHRIKCRRGFKMASYLREKSLLYSHLTNTLCRLCELCGSTQKHFIDRVDQWSGTKHYYPFNPFITHLVVGPNNQLILLYSLKSNSALSIYAHTKSEVSILIIE